MAERQTVPRVVPPGGGEVVGDSPDRRVEILADHHALHATWSRFGPRRDGADLHVHRRHSDLFYVLDGELTVRLGAEDERLVASAGTLAVLPPLVVHGFRNGGDAAVSYLNLHAPGEGFASYMRALRDGRTLVYDQEPPPADGTRAATEAEVDGEGLTVDLPGLRVVLLADVEAIAVAETTVDPGAALAPHVHRRHVESFYVLEGELALTAGERAFRAPAGSWVEVPAGVPHELSVAGSEPVRLLNVHTPSCGFGAFARALAGGTDEQAAADRAGFDQESARPEPEPLATSRPARG